MYSHHQAVIDKLTARFQPDARFLGLIIGGSVAKGWAAESSDVDIMLVATDEEYARRAPTNDLLYFATDVCDYPGGYVDGKIIDIGYLQDAADRGSEPTRSAFRGAFLAYSHLPALADMIQQIPVYPEHEREAKIRAFYCQVMLLTWYVGEAEKRADTYLLTHTASELVFFASRLLLAHNRILYPYHKWMMYVLRPVEDKPADFMMLAETLLQHPSKANAQAVCDSIIQFLGWTITMQEAGADFMKTREWNWRNGNTPLQDW